MKDMKKLIGLLLVLAVPALAADECKASCKEMQDACADRSDPPDDVKETRRRRVYSVVCDFQSPAIGDEELDLLLECLGVDLAALLDVPQSKVRANEGRPLSPGFHSPSG